MQAAASLAEQPFKRPNLEQGFTGMAGSGWRGTLRPGFVTSLVRSSCKESWPLFFGAKHGEECAEQRKIRSL